MNGRTNDVSYKRSIRTGKGKEKRIDKREKGKRSRRKKEIIAGEIINGRGRRVGELAASQKRGD